MDLVFIQSQKKILKSSLSFGQATLTFCLSGTISCLLQLVILVLDDLPRPLPIKSYLPSKIICLPQTTNWDFFQPVFIITIKHDTGCFAISKQHFIFCERFQPRSHFKSRLSLIVRVNVVLNTGVLLNLPTCQHVTQTISRVVKSSRLPVKISAY